MAGAILAAARRGATGRGGGAGTMAASIQSADELVLTEMVFNGAFTDLSPEQCVALLSAFIWTEKSDAATKARPHPAPAPPLPPSDPALCSDSSRCCHLHHVMSLIHCWYLRSNRRGCTRRAFDVCGRHRVREPSGESGVRQPECPLTGSNTSHCLMWTNWGAARPCVPTSRAITVSARLMQPGVGPDSKLLPTGPTYSMSELLPKPHTDLLGAADGLRGRGAQVRADLEAPWAALQEAARRVGKAALDAKMPVDVPQYVASFRPELMELVSAWARGARFADLLRSTDVFEVRRCTALITHVSALSQPCKRCQL